MAKRAPEIALYAQGGEREQSTLVARCITCGTGLGAYALEADRDAAMADHAQQGHDVKSYVEVPVKDADAAQKKVEARIRARAKEQSR